jgi:serine protease Do
MNTLGICLISLFCWFPFSLQSIDAWSANSNFSHVAEAAMPSIVRIENLCTEQNKDEKPKLKRYLGTGFCISSDGYILTNYHVICDSEKLSVFFHNEQEFDAQVVGFDANTDIALLKIAATGLKPFTFANSDAVRIGEFVVALGHPYSEKLTFTLGVVSGKNRHHRDDTLRVGVYIQTDAAINPGNSGGPLLNSQGEVVGMNSFMIGPRHEEGKQVSFAGMGYAISSNCIQSIVEQIQKKGFVRHGFLGIEVHTLDSSIADVLNVTPKEGVIITSVQRGGPGARAGLKVGDVICSINQEAVVKRSGFYTKIAFMKPGQELLLNVCRNGKSIQIKAYCAADPNDGKEELKRAFGLVVEKLSPSECRKLGGSPKESMLFVQKVIDRSPAYYAKIEPGSFIYSVNQVSAANVQDLYQAVVEKSKGGVSLFLVKQKERSHFVALRSAK